MVDVDTWWPQWVAYKEAQRAFEEAMEDLRMGAPNEQLRNALDAAAGRRREAWDAFSEAFKL